MTLAQWITQYQRLVHVCSDEACWLPDYVGDGRADLWRLSDYLVSSVTGGSIWLVRR